MSGQKRKAVRAPFNPVESRFRLPTTKATNHASKNTSVRCEKFRKTVGREGFEPSTIGLKDSCLIYRVFINQSLTVFVHLGCARKHQ